MCERFPSVKKVRFNNSGTEATLSALRVARAFTGKDKILKIFKNYYFKKYKIPKAPQGFIFSPEVLIDKLPIYGFGNRLGS